MSKIETKCGSENCPIKDICATYSDNTFANLIPYDFEVIQGEPDEQIEVKCDEFEKIVEDEFEFYK